MNMTTNMDMNDTTTTNADDMGHDIVWIHPFVIYLVDQDDDLRKKIIGTDWDPNEVENLVEKLL